MQIGGQVSFSLDQAVIRTETYTGFTLKFDPTFGIFIMRNVEFEAQAIVEIPFGDLHSDSSKTLGFTVGVKYIYDRALVAHLFPYAGVTVGPAFLLAVPGHGDSATFILINGQVGVLLPLNQWVALDFGVQAQHWFLASGTNSGEVDVYPVGFFGATAFF